VTGPIRRLADRWYSEGAYWQKLTVIYLSVAMFAMIFVVIPLFLSDSSEPSPGRALQIANFAGLLGVGVRIGHDVLLVLLYRFLRP
jgi:hypothetical protein